MSAENTPPANLPLNTNFLLALGGCGILATGVLLGFALDRPSPPAPPLPPNPHARFNSPGPEGHGRLMGRRSEGQPDQREARRQERRGPDPEMRAGIQKWSEPLGKIREKYQGEIAKILRPEQKSKLEETVKNRGERRGPGGPGDLMGAILIAPQLDRIATHLVLDESQKKQVETILKKQREEILVWVDSNPPPKPQGRPQRMSDMNEPDMEREMTEGFAAFLPERPELAFEE